MTDEVTQREDLRDFLRAARARVDPADLSLVTPPGRRGRGLQQADMAIVLGVSHRWYHGFEGGTVTASGAMLDQIAVVLQLIPAERVHLYLLATGHDPAPGTVQSPAGTDAVLIRLVQQMGELAVPTLVTDIAWNVSAWNNALAAWFPDPGGFPRHTRNLVLWAFSSDLERCLHDADRFRQACIGWVHLAHAGHPGDHRLADLVGRLQTIPAARELWASQHVAGFTNTIITLQFRPGDTDRGEADLLSIEFPGGSRLIMIVPAGEKTARAGALLRLIPRETTPVRLGLAAGQRPEPPFMTLR